ncbi:MAG: hypothetical protein KGL95_06535, partial [Patescibacteria group bacterium]|nr:hypothetical protein [Patescibacteria group bacterium]
MGRAIQENSAGLGVVPPLNMIGVETGMGEELTVLSQADAAPNVILGKDISLLSEILDLPPFNREKDPSRTTTVYCDFDGVVGFLVPSRSSWQERIGRWRALAEVMKKTDRFVWYSARGNYPEDWWGWRMVRGVFDRGRFSAFPYISEKSQQRLIEFGHHVNPGCEIEFMGGPRKMLGGSFPQYLQGTTHDGFIESASRELADSKRDVVVIGSGRNEDRRVKALQQALTAGQKVGNIYHG